MTWTRSIAMLAAGGLLLTACGSNDDPVAATPTVAETPTTEPTTTAAPTTEPGVVAIVSVDEGVAGYPACGNEPITFDGVTWYPIGSDLDEPFDDDIRERLADVRAVDREPSPVSARQGFKRVVAPGPGDDVGTLVVWADGVARWVSDSRDLDVWLIDQEVTYHWVC